MISPSKIKGEKQGLFKTHGTCGQFIEVEVKDDIVTKCVFHGGCDGNTKGGYPCWA